MAHMKCVLAFCFSILCAVVLGDFNANEYCASLEPQPHVSIEKLVGMWYAIEIISHRKISHRTSNSPVCPVIHISEDKSSLYPTTNPLHTNYNYGYNYGTGGRYDSNSDRYDSNSDRYDSDYEQRESTRTDPYDRERPTRYPTRYHDHRDYVPKSLAWKHLRLLWIEYENTVEYNLKYNESSPGFLISSGPKNGSSLEAQYDHFAGTIQVLKAVGSHLVLSFCYRLPEPQLFTVILSREYHLDSADIFGVHSLMMRKNLAIEHTKRACLHNGASRLDGVGGAVCLVVLVASVLVKGMFS